MKKKISNLVIFRDILIKTKRYYTAIELAKLIITKIDRM